MTNSGSSQQKMLALRGEIAGLVDRYAALAYEPIKFTPGVTPIPPSGKLLDGAELKLMVEASLDGWLTVDLTTPSSAS